MNIKEAKELSVLVTSLKGIDTTYIGRNLYDLPYEIDCVAPIYGEDDGNDTDIHKVSASFNPNICIAFNVEVMPQTHTIVDINLHCVDIIYDGQLHDCIDLDTYEIIAEETE